MAEIRYDRHRAQRRRIELGMSPADLARATDIPVWSIYSYEQDRAAQPRPPRIHAIAEALQMEPGDLLVEVEEGAA